MWKFFELCGSLVMYEPRPRREILSLIHIYGDQSGRVYGKTLPSLEKKELRQTGLAEWIRSHPITDPEKYLAVWKRLPQMEQIWKAGLQRLTKECFHNCDNVRKLVLNPSEPGLIRALGLDASKFRRLRQIDGDTETLAWLQLEKRTGQRITDDMLRWSEKEQISAKDLVFIADRMSLVQIDVYKRQPPPSWFWIHFKRPADMVPGEGMKGGMTDGLVPG